MVEGPEEQSKFRALVARYERLMFHVARQILPNEQDAADAESKAIDIARKNAHQGQQVPLEDLPGLSVPAQGEDSLTQCILRLPARYRAWIQLHYAQGYTAEETAEILGLSKEAGYKLGQRAKQRLEILCREEGLL